MFFSKVIVLLAQDRNKLCCFSQWVHQNSQTVPVPSFWWNICGTYITSGRLLSSSFRHFTTGPWLLNSETSFLGNIHGASVKQKGSLGIQKFKNLKCLCEVHICETFHIGFFFSWFLVNKCLKSWKTCSPRIQFLLCTFRFCLNENAVLAILVICCFLLEDMFEHHLTCH